jgi:hypothetical protein
VPGPLLWRQGIQRVKLGENKCLWAHGDRQLIQEMSMGGNTGQRARGDICKSVCEARDVMIDSWVCGLSDSLMHGKTFEQVI